MSEPHLVYMLITNYFASQESIGRRSHAIAAAGVLNIREIRSGASCFRCSWAFKERFMPKKIKSIFRIGVWKGNKW